MGGRGSISARTRACLVLGASVAALAVSQNAQAQALCPDGQPGPVCVINNSGESGPIVGQNGGALNINNTGTITGAPAISMGGASVLIVNNEPTGVITGTNGVAITMVPRLIAAVDNEGTINGNVVNNDAPAPNPFTLGAIYYIANGGTVNGDVQLGTSGFSSANFIQRGADDGVTGTISAGAGLDIYTKSYTSSQALVLGLYGLPTTFEIEGYEALGTDTTLTLLGSSTTINLSGNGNVVNNATINLVNAAPHFPAGTNVVPAAIGYYQTNFAVFRRPQIPLGQPGSFLSVPMGNALTSFVNNGIVNGDIQLATASFVNNGDVNLVTRSNGTTIFTKANSAFVFNNTGSIEMTDTGARLPGTAIAAEFETGIGAAVRLRSAVNTTAAADVSISNSGTIIGGLDVKVAAEDFTFENTGTIEGIDNPGGYYTPGLILGVGELSLVAGGEQAESHFDAATATFVNSATGSIDHGTEAYFSAFEVSFTNNGFMAGADISPDALYIEQYLDADDVDATSFSFANAGTIEGNVGIEAETTAVSITNSGTITGANYATINQQNFPDIMFGGEAAIAVDNETSSDQTLTFVNSGSVLNTVPAGSGVVIEVDAGEEDEGTGEVVVASALVDVNNSGTISATGGATIVTQQYATFLEPGQFLVNPLGGLVVDASDVQHSVINIENASGAMIEAGGNPTIATPNGYNAIPNSVPGAFTSALLAAGGTVNITNSGTIRGGNGTTVGPNAVLDELELPDDYMAGAIQTGGDEHLVDGVEVYIASTDHLTNTSTGVIIGSIDLGGSDDTIDNNGSITGDIYLRDGVDALSNYGSISGNLFFGAGNDSFTQGVSATFNGTADGQDGEDSFFLDLTGGGTIDNTIYDRLINFEQFALIGEGQVDVELGEEDDNFENTGNLEGEVDLGSGDNEFNNTGTVTGNVTSGEGNDEVSNEGTIDGNVNLGDGSNQFVNNGTVTGNVEGGSDSDAVDNSGEINGSVDLGAGENQFANSGVVNGNVSSGDDDDDVSNEGTINGDVNLDGSGGVPAAALAMAKRLNAIGILAIGGGDDEFTNSETVNGNVFAGGGNDVVTNSGTITGNIDLGDGDDILNLLGDWAIGGTATGGAGTDLLDLTLGGGTEPHVLDLAGFTSFETLELSGGIGLIDGAASFGLIRVAGGRLIGDHGSHITANVQVTAGATFGSAGTVTGNIAVASGGTLSPGASPAVMTVVGDVSLASGSTTVFEFVPAPGQSDQLIIDGDLTIASGATLNMTGNRPLTPGVTYDMIIADTITGEFTIGTWNQSQVQGFLRYLDGATDDRLQLLGTFVFDGDAPPQAELAIDYVNSLLVSGGASSALFGSISSLLNTDGFASAAAFSLLTPEPYSSATQLGVESGLSLAKLSRSGLAEVEGEAAGLFGFGTAYGNWRTMDADAVLGTSKAKNRDYGVVGGLGFGNATASGGAFVGYVEGRQRIAALGSETESDGIVAGVAGHFGAGGFNLDALVGYDWSEAETTRAVPGAAALSSEYDLESLVLDGAASYDLPLGGLTLTPGVGVTHVSVRRGAAVEGGSPAFALNVDGDRHSATFIDASLGISAPLDSGIRPWARIGVREQVEGELVVASAGLLGTTTRFVVPGAPREGTVVTAGAGLEAALGANVTVSASYNGEFGGGTGSNAAIGLRAKF